MELPINYHVTHWSIRKKAREQYSKEQDYCCYHCKSLLAYDPPDKITNTPINKNLFPKGFFNWPIHLHHDHNTGMTIGAVHCYCNAVLWEYHGE